MSAAARAGHRLRVLVVGDSVMEGARPALPGALAEADVTVDTAVSRSTVAGVDVLRSHGTAWDVIVVELGANDGGTEGVFRPRVQRLLDTVSGVPHVVFLTIHEARPYYRTANNVIRQEAAAHPNVTVADWNAEASAHPEALAPDGIHLTSPNVGLLAGFVATHVRQAAGTLPPSTVAVATTALAAAPRSVTTRRTTTTEASTADRTEATGGSGGRNERSAGRSTRRRTELRTGDRPASKRSVPEAVLAILVVAALGAALAGRRSRSRART